MANDAQSPLSGSFAVRSAMLGFAGALMLLGGVPTLIIGLLTGARGTIDIGVLLLVGGFLFALIGVPAAIYFRSHTGSARRGSHDPSPRDDGGGWV